MFRRILNNKIGNILSFLATQAEPLYMTKALKLLYLIDETAARQSGSPITWLDYKVWKNGPVAPEIYYELKNNQVTFFGAEKIALDTFIKIERKRNFKTRSQTDIKITPLTTYDFSQFSEFEENIVRSVAANYGHFSAPELIALLHAEGSRWHQIVTDFNLEQHFKLRSDTSDYSIDFVDLIEGDEFLKLAAQASYESLEFQDNLQNTVEYTA